MPSIRASERSGNPYYIANTALRERIESLCEASVEARLAAHEAWKRGEFAAHYDYLTQYHEHEVALLALRPSLTPEDARRQQQTRAYHQSMAMTLGMAGVTVEQA